MNCLITNLNREIGIGYHSHNNFQLAYSNSIEVLRETADRRVLIDASFVRHGKSAGNLPLELISMYMNTSCGRNFNTAQMLEAIDINIMPFFRKAPGVIIFSSISPPQTTVIQAMFKFLMDKQTLSLKALNGILDSIEPEKNCSMTKITLNSFTVLTKAQSAMMRRNWQN